MNSPKKEPKAAKPSLVNKLVEVLGGLGPVKKEHRNPHFGYNYVSEGQIMGLLAPRLAERGVLFTTSVLTMEVRYGEPKEGVFVAVTTEHTFTDAHSKESLTIKGAGVGWDSGDKGVYKAITGATKYALMKTFMITDEQEPESGEQAPVAKPGAIGHRRTKAYEEETGKDDTKVAADLLNLKAFLTEQKIPDGFLLQLLREKKLIDGHTTNVAQLKPGILRRCLSPNTRANLIKAWTMHKADEDSDGETTTTSSKEKHPFNGEEVRTNEGDQTPRSILRTPIDEGLDLHDVLGQDGHEDWRQVPIHFGKKKGTPLGKLTAKDLLWWVQNWKAEPYKGTWEDKVILLDAALCLASREMEGA